MPEIEDEKEKGYGVDTYIKEKEVKEKQRLFTTLFNRFYETSKVIQDMSLILRFYGTQTCRRQPPETKEARVAFGDALTKFNELWVEVNEMWDEVNPI